MKKFMVQASRVNQLNFNLLSIHERVNARLSVNAPASFAPKPSTQITTESPCAKSILRAYMCARSARAKCTGPTWRKVR